MIEKCVAYVASSAIILFSLIPLYTLWVIYDAMPAINTFLEFVWGAFMESNSFEGFVLAFSLPIFAIFFSAILIIWVHKEKK